MRFSFIIKIFKEKVWSELSSTPCSVFFDEDGHTEYSACSLPMSVQPDKLSSAQLLGRRENCSLCKKKNHTIAGLQCL